MNGEKWFLEFDRDERTKPKETIRIELRAIEVKLATFEALGEWNNIKHQNFKPTEVSNPKLILSIDLK